MLYDRDPEGFEVEILRYATKQTYDTRMWQLLEHKARAIEQIRRGTITSRTTEDVDGEAANAAEMKAAASGNPLIMEEIKLRVNVQKLEGLEQASKRQRFALQGQASRLADADKRVAEVERRVQPFIEARQPKLEQGFTFTTAEGQNVTDVGKLAEPLLTPLKSAIEGDHAYIGKYRGIDLWFGAGGHRSEPWVDVVAGVGKKEHPLDWRVGRITLTTYTKGQEFKPSGFLTRLDNAYELFEKKIEETKTLANRDKAELAKVNAELNKPWERADELERARAEHRRVLALIDAGETEPQPVVPPPGGEFNGAASRRGQTGMMGSVRSSYGVDVDEVQAVIDRVTKGVKNIASGGVKVVASVNDLPADARGFVYAQGAANDVEGIFDKNSRAIYLVAENLASPERAQFVIFHELFGHYGLRGMFGEKLNAELSEIWIKNDNVRRETARLMKKYGYTQGVATEEALSTWRGAGETFTGLKRLMAKIQAMLREMGLDEVANWLEAMTDAEALSTARPSSGVGGREGAAFVHGGTWRSGIGLQAGRRERL